MSKVLLVDDDRRFVEVAARELMQRGFEVDEAADGLQAIEKALEQPPDVAVVDLVMPRVGGAQVVAFFRQNAYLTGVPVIVLSGVVAESLGTVEALDVELVMAKGPREETARRLFAAVERVVRDGRGVRAIDCPPEVSSRRQVVELLGVARDLGAVLDSAAFGVLELDLRGRVAFANRRADQLLGVEPDALIDADVLSVFPRSGVARLRALMARFETDQGPATRAMTVTADDQALRASLTSVWRDGERHGLVLTLAEMTARLDDDSRPTRLLQYLAHEMRSSLLIMDEHLRGLVAAGGGGHVPAADRQSGDTIGFLAQETGRLLRLLGDATQLHRTMRELTDLDLEPVDLGGVIEDSLSGITALAGAQGVDVSYGRVAGSPKVRGDRDRLIQVLYNLLLNALRATPRGGAIRVEIARERDGLATTVVDSGRGIAPEELREILVQAQRPELFLPTKGKRVGLGLSIAHQIVRAHGGHMTAESAPGAGSRFGFVLPAWTGTPSDRPGAGR